jgi:SAM-dependent methyltransferase
VAQIFAYNRTFYLGAFAALACVLVMAGWLPPLPRAIAILFLIAATFWTLASLAVSHWVYDRSPLYSLNWLVLRPRKWLNVHAGLDEMTDLLKTKFPAANYRVFDIFDPAEMTEPSIARARALSGPNESQPVPWSHLPANNNAFDMIFLPFVAHEFRRTHARHTFFQELARVLAPNGKIILIEHLRDTPNFLAFGPGFLHFQSRRTWTIAFHAANLTLSREHRITPFVHVFEIERSN